MSAILGLSINGILLATDKGHERKIFERQHHFVFKILLIDLSNAFALCFKAKNIIAAEESVKIAIKV